MWGKPGPTPLFSFPYSPHWPAGQNFQRDRRQREVGQGGEFFPDVSVCGLAAVGLSFSPCTPILAEGEGRGVRREVLHCSGGHSVSAPPGSNAAWWCLGERQGKKRVDSGRQRDSFWELTLEDRRADRRVWELSQGPGARALEPVTERATSVTQSQTTGFNFPPGSIRRRNFPVSLAF